MKAASSPERRFIAGYAAAFCGVLALVATANYVVNPYGIYPPRLLRPYSWNLRQAKVDRLLHAQSAPDVLLLGSSRAFALRPDHVQERCGLTAYNASVTSGRFIDYLALANAAFTRPDAKRTRVIILQLDVESFWDDIDVPYELRATPALLRFAAAERRAALDDEIEPSLRLVSLSQLLDSARSVRQHVAGVPPNLSVDTDGVVHFASREAAIDAGHYDLRAAIAEEIPYEEQLFRERHAISDVQIRRFEDIANTVRRHDARLIVWLSPMHPDLIDVLRPLGWERQHQDILSLLERLHRTSAFELHDMTTVDRFEGRVSEFLNATHVTAPGADRILDVLLGEACR